MNLTYFTALFIALPISVFITSLFDKIAKEEFPPILPHINNHSFAQAIIVIVAAFVLESSSRDIGLGAFSLLLLLVVLLLFQTALDQTKQKKTEKHVSSVLEQKVRNCLKKEFDFQEVKDFVLTFVQEDFLPGSWTQKWSGWPRQKRRTKLADLINAHFCDGLEQPISQEDFLLPKNETRASNVLYALINIFSVAIYAIIVILYGSK